MKHIGSLFLSPLVAILLLSRLMIPIEAQGTTGAISGRIVADDGQPIPYATIIVNPLDGSHYGQGRRVITSTDEQGNFRAEGLDAAPYTVTLIAPGYVIQPQGYVNGLVQGLVNYNYIGDSVTVRMVKGGIITGRVQNDRGEPIIGIPVKALRLRDEQGNQMTELPQLESGNATTTRQTDDRGIYRLYGLEPGSYIISAGGSGFSTRPTPFDGRVLIYYPSDVRAAAKEVAVHSSEEVTGIDIRYRNEQGNSISGKITNLPVSGGRGSAPTYVSLRQAGTDNVVGITSLRGWDNENGYSFYGLPNGNYEVIAVHQSFNDDSSLISAPRRVTINGRDINNVDLNLTPMATIKGAVVVEAIGAVQKCEISRKSLLNEVIIRAHRNNPNDKKHLLFSPSSLSSVGAIAGDGTFSIRGLNAGSYRLQLLLPDNGWYVKSIEAKSLPTTLRNIAKNGVTLKPGELLNGVHVSLTTGAASLKGRVSTHAGIQLPKWVRVHLTPTEPELRDDVLRFSETIADSDGSFTFNNIPPGKYWLLVQPLTDTEVNNHFALPLAWDSIKRAKLRREAETGNIAMELKPCQQVSNYILSYTR